MIETYNIVTYWLEKVKSDKYISWRMYSYWYISSSKLEINFFFHAVITTKVMPDLKITNLVFLSLEDSIHPMENIDRK